mmetsp:Transcript_30584/g.89500  ORF Transcript_30584/g.89500 Transcript_30584/m.89500 type:complete len:224 (-) Transcript_30584:8-679(-)
MTADRVPTGRQRFDPALDGFGVRRGVQLATASCGVQWEDLLRGAPLETASSRGVRTRTRIRCGHRDAFTAPNNLDEQPAAAASRDISGRVNLLRHVGHRDPLRLRLDGRTQSARLDRVVDNVAAPADAQHVGQHANKAVDVECGLEVRVALLGVAWPVVVAKTPPKRRVAQHDVERTARVRLVREVAHHQSRALGDSSVDVSFRRRRPLLFVSDAQLNDSIEC